MERRANRREKHGGSRGRFLMKPRFFLILWCISICFSSCRAQNSEPDADAMWTSTREIRALRCDGETLWAATAGGVLRFERGKWTKWTRREGLPSHEAFAFEGGNGKTVRVRFASHWADFEGQKWQISDAAPFQSAIPEVSWRGQKVRGELEGLRVGKRNFGFPAASGATHIAALQPRGKTLLVGLYNAGIWNFDGAKWKRAFSDLPQNAREITALAQNEKAVWVGTRRDGIFRFRDGKWTPFTRDEPYNANIQNLGQFGGVLYGSTLDDGLILRENGKWKRVSTPVLSSNAPRQMVEWKNQLFVRHGSGVVDSFDGKNWTKNALKSAPRAGIYALASDENTLFAAGWGGWSEWDGEKWTPHFEIAALKNVPVMGFLPDGEWLWIATQSRGVGRFHRASGEFRFFDERDGLGDDWITTLQKIDGKIYAGTFVGGLARLDGEKWHPFEALRGQNITAIEGDGQGTIWVAARRGLWKISGDSAQKIDVDGLESELQTLWKGENGLWIGARTSLSFRKQSSTRDSEK